MEANLARSIARSSTHRRRRSRSADMRKCARIGSAESHRGVRVGPDAHTAFRRRLRLRPLSSDVRARALCCQQRAALPNFVSIADVAAALGTSRRTIERRIRAGTLPRPERLSPGKVGWRRELIVRTLIMPR